MKELASIYNLKRELIEPKTYIDLDEFGLLLQEFQKQANFFEELRERILNKFDIKLK